MTSAGIIGASRGVVIFLSLITPYYSPLALTNNQDRALERKVESIVEAGRREVKLPGVSIVIMRGNKVLLAKGYGLADREKGTAASETTIYPIASLSKQFTAAAVMKLVERGRVRLDEPVKTYLPEYAAKQTEVLRIRHLLRQTSGVPEWNVLPEMQGIDSGEPSRFTVPKIIELLGRRPQLYQPGDWWSYSNSNYTLLAAVIERVGGVSYEQFLSANFFAPLRLRSTGNCTPERGLSPNPLHAVGYLAVGNSFELRPLTATKAQAYVGSGGLCSNAVDLAKWMRALIDGKAVSAASYREMTTTTPVSTGFTPPYGFGLSVVPLAEQPAVWHIGVLAGFTSVLAYFPKHDLIIATQTNSRHAPLQTLVRRVTRAVVNLKEPELLDLQIGAEQLSRVVGSYDDAMFKFRVYAESGRLYIHVPELGEPKRMQYQGGGIFATPEPGMIRLWFEPANGNVERVVWEWGEIRAYGRKLR